MSKLIIVVVMWMAMAGYGLSQTSAPTQIVKKFVGETTMFTWDFDVSEEFLITHFSLRMIDDLTKTTVELKTVAKNLRGTSISSSFTPGMKFMYYNVVSVNNAVSPVEVSQPSNTVATERVGKPPRNLLGQ